MDPYSRFIDSEHGDEQLVRETRVAVAAGVVEQPVFEVVTAGATVP